MNQSLKKPLLMFVAQHHADQIVDVKKRMELLFVHVKMNTSEHRLTANQNVRFTVNVHKIKRAINSNAQILVLEHAVLEQVGEAFSFSLKSERFQIIKQQMILFYFRVPSDKP